MQDDVARAVADQPLTPTATKPLVRSTASGKPRLVELDNLRALALLLVVVAHTWVHTSRYTFNAGPFPISKWLASIFAIPIFMVLSGFVLAYPLVTADGWKKLDVWDFYRRRGLRIVLPYYAVIAVGIMLSFIVPAIYAALGSDHQSTLPRPTFVELVSHLFFVRNITTIFDPSIGTINGVFWSIELLVAYYVLFPLIILVTRRFGVLNMVAGALLITGAWRVCVWLTFAHTQPQLMPNLAWSIPGRFFEFALGILAALVIYRHQRIINGWLALGLAILFYWIGMFLTAQIEGQFFASTDLILGLSAFFLVLAVCGVNTLRRAISVRPLFWIGGFAYSLYLVHTPLIQELYSWFPQKQGEDAFLTYTVGFTLVALVAAYLFYLAIERPVAILGRKLVRRQQQPTPPAPTIEQPLAGG